MVEPRLREPSLGKFEGIVRTGIYSDYGDLFAKLAALGHKLRLVAVNFLRLTAHF